MIIVACCFDCILSNYYASMLSPFGFTATPNRIIPIGSNLGSFFILPMGFNGIDLILLVLEKT